MPKLFYYLRAFAEKIEREDLKLSFLKLRDELINKINKLKALNDTLRELIAITNGVIDITIKELTGFKEVGYKNDKKKSKMSEGNLLNRKG